MSTRRQRVRAHATPRKDDAAAGLRQQPREHHTARLDCDPPARERPLAGPYSVAPDPTPVLSCSIDRRIVSKIEE